ncbi:MAG: hypothetical protein ACRD2I_00300, partial [Vicinamibacterales bacterium]
LADAETTALGRVPVASLAADERLIDFDVATELAGTGILHRQPDAVEHEPRGFLRTPSDRAISWLDTPFFMLAIIHTHGNHLSKPSGESSKTVPVLSENFRFGC